MFSIIPRLLDLPRVFFDTFRDEESGTGKQMENTVGWYTRINQTIQYFLLPEKLVESGLKQFPAVKF